MVERRLVSWDEYKAELRQKDGAPLDPIYRGHGKATWALVPPSKRPRFDQLRRRSERAQENPEFAVCADYASPVFDGQLKYFKRLATGLPGADVTRLSDDDIEALARHNGLCSNLLDWTISPYIAAFFAFTVALDLSNDGRLTAGTLNLSAICLPIEPVAIWRLGARPDLWVGGEFELLSDLTAVNRWQKSQDGVFTRLRHNEFACAAEYLESIGKGDALTCFEVPGGGALSALDELNDMRINFANLFPDLRGAALQANLVSALKLA